MTPPFHRWIGRHQVVSFYFLAFAFSWLAWTPQAAYSRGLLQAPSPLLALLGGGGPTLAALIVTFLVGGFPRVRDLLKPILIWRVRPQWFAAALLLQPLVLIAAFGLSVLLGNPAPDFQTMSSWVILLPILLGFFVAGLWEEVGWRGFALPKLQARHNALVSSIIIGVLWGSWHLPLFLDTGNPMSTFPFIAWFVGTVASSVLYTWLYNNTRGSLLIVGLFHASANTATAAVFTALGGAIAPQDFLLATAANCLVAAIVVLIFGPACLSRQPT